MSAARSLAAWAVCCLAVSVPAARADAVSVSHYELLQRLSISTPNVDGSHEPSAVGPVEVGFDALGKTFRLQLTPNSNLLGAARDTMGGDVLPYRGRLAGIPQSWARIVIADGEPAGIIWDGNELFAIESSRDNVVGASATIIYRLADVLIAPGSMTCAVEGHFTNAATAYKSLTRELRAAAAEGSGAAVEIDVGAIADAEFYGLHGQDSQTEILTRLNNVDGVFSAQLGVQINVPLVQVFSDSSAPAYPFSNTVTAGDLLDELATYRNGNPNQNANGLTHLWTGRDVESDTGNTSTVGIAFTGTFDGSSGFLALCDTTFGAGLSEGRSGPTFDGMVAAHEIGHNFGAPHDGEPGSACESESGFFLMATSLTPATQNSFSQCSVDQMSDDAAEAQTRGCITPLPSVDMRIGLDGPDPSILLGNTATMTFDVANAGTVQATNVAADITLPNNVSLISAAASIGNCSDGGGVVNCLIGDVDGTTTVTVTLTSDTIAVGSGNFDATVAADADDDMANNQDSAVLTVEPAVNLGVNPPSGSRIDVNASTNLTAILENTSILDATGVSVSITLSSGLRADSATWTAGTCNVVTGQVDCQAATLAAQTTSTFTLGVTATTEGSQSVEVTMTSAEADADPSNNTATATVTVGSVEDDDSGGGGTSPLFLLLLGLVASLERFWKRD